MLSDIFVALITTRHFRVVMFKLILAAISAVVIPQAFAQEDPTLLIPPATSSQRVTDLAALKKWITHKNGCDDSTIKVQIDTLLYFDFRGDGKKELIVDASTCWTGTAGPDVHSVFFRHGHGQFTEYEFPEVDKKYYAKLVGNRNFFLSMDLGVESGLVVQTWWDESDRGYSPLVIRYRWDGKGFVVAAVIAPFINLR